jgi:hypothetical protein
VEHLTGGTSLNHSIITEASGFVRGELRRQCAATIHLSPAPPFKATIWALFWQCLSLFLAEMLDVPLLKLTNL